MRTSQFAAAREVLPFITRWHLVVNSSRVERIIREMGMLIIKKIVKYTLPKALIFSVGFHLGYNRIIISFLWALGIYPRWFWRLLPLVADTYIKDVPMSAAESADLINFGESK